MAGELVYLILAVVLLVAATMKLVAPRSSADALGTFGISSGWLRWGLWLALVSVELSLAVTVALGIPIAAYLAAGLMSSFGLALLLALGTGQAGAPCACFGSRSRVSYRGALRSFGLGACFALVPLLPNRDLSGQQWLILGLVVALVSCVALAVALLALAREVAMLRLRVGPQAALEIPEEGPRLGGRTDVVDDFAVDSRINLLLGVFLSESCRVCNGLMPGVESLSRDPFLAVRVFEEDRDAELWRRLGIPGAPFALALDLDGTVLAKGTFNNLAQLESVLASAERRRQPAAKKMEPAYA